MVDSALQHSCEQHGCAKRYLDPKLHKFDDCFAGGIRFGDVDGAVERNGHILWLEWKRGAVLDSFERQHQAQLIMAKAFTLNSSKQMFVFVIGCPIHMDIERWRPIRNGQWSGSWRESNTEEFMKFLKWWFDRADADMKVAQ